MSDQRGFTLIEILVAVIVTSLLLVSVYGVFATISGARQRVEKDSEHYHQARVIFDRLGREIHGVYWVTGGSATSRRSGLRGGLDENSRTYLELATTTATPQSGGAGIVLVRYELLPDPEHSGQFQLMRSERPLFTTEFQASDTLRMTSGIANLQLRFYGAGTWQDSWDTASGGLPTAIEISLTEATPDGPLPFVTSFTVAPLKGKL